ncbi:MAG: amidohydrolase family protein [Gaiellaceae bacterium]
MTAVTLTGATVLESLDPPVVSTGPLSIDDGRIAAGAGDRAQRDCSGCVVVPGNVCAHTHLYSALARGMPYSLEAPDDFLQVLQRIWWRLDRALDLPSIRASAAVGAFDALLAGTTTVIDHHASPNAIDGSLDAIEAELSSLGLRSVLCYEVSDRDGEDSARRGLQETRRFLHRVRQNHLPITRALVGAHAAFTLSDDTLRACIETARDYDVGLHVHAAEDAVDAGAVERLAATGAIDERTLLAHGVHLDDHELALVADAHAWLAHNARSNMNNSVGRARVAGLDLRLPLGTDGIGGDMFEESRTAFFRLREDDIHAPGDWALRRLADAARLAGSIFDEPLLGTLVPGAPADLVVLDYDAPTPFDAESVAGHWIFGLGSRFVRDVMVAGEWSILDRAAVRVDAHRLAHDSRREAARLWHRLDDVGPHPFVPKGSRSWQTTAA